VQRQRWDSIPAEISPLLSQLIRVIVRPLLLLPKFCGCTRAGPCLFLWISQSIERIQAAESTRQGIKYKRIKWHCGPRPKLTCGGHQPAPCWCLIRSEWNHVQTTWNDPCYLHTRYQILNLSSQNGTNNARWKRYYAHPCASSPRATQLGRDVNQVNVSYVNQSFPLYHMEGTLLRCVGWLPQYWLINQHILRDAPCLVKSVGPGILPKCAFIFKPSSVNFVVLDKHSTLQYVILCGSRLRNLLLWKCWLWWTTNICVPQGGRGPRLLLWRGILTGDPIMSFPACMLHGCILVAVKLATLHHLSVMGSGVGGQQRWFCIVETCWTRAVT
jgi:hypothetical protein